MSLENLLFEVTSIPDPSFLQYQQRAGGNVKKAIWVDAEQLLGSLSAMPPESASLVICYCFSPAPESGHPQQRLRIFIGGAARDDRAFADLSAILTNGPLLKYYETRRADVLPLARGPLRSACHVYRNDGLIPAHTTRNPHAMALYYHCTVFAENGENDGTILDKVLNTVDEYVVIALAFEPTSIAREVRALTKYTSRLRDVNGSYGGDGMDSPIDLLARKEKYRGGPIRVRPIQQRDPVADDVRRRMERHIETMSSAHLHFHVVTLAETEATARLVGSVLAQSCFKEGTQTVVHSEPRSVDHILDRIQALRVPDHDAHPLLVRNTAPYGYPSLACLSHVATAEELRGAARLPVASIGSPLCLRKNTDLPCETPDDLIVFGYDASLPQSEHNGRLRPVPRGIRLRDLAKHIATLGMPGSGKSFSNVNTILQVSGHGVSFLAIESVKKEYRTIKLPHRHVHAATRSRAAVTEFFTPGNDKVSPFRFSPLQLLPGVSPDEHIDALRECFCAAMPLGGPMSAILGRALGMVYRQHPNRDTPPLMTDLLTAAESVLADAHYSTALHNDLRAAIDMRLGTLTTGTMGRIFQCRHSVPDIYRMLSTPTILELDNLTDETACLLILFLLTAMREALR